VNTSLWTVILPFGQSQISESGGSLTTTGRGTLETVAGFNYPFMIGGAVTFNDGLEHFEVTFRSDLQTGYQSHDGSQYYELTGLKVVFSIDGGGISIQDFTQTDASVLAIANYPMAVGTPYNFLITDTGNQVDLSVNGANLLSAFTDYSTGNRIAFQSREFGSTSSSLDFVSIQPVPEPSSFALAGLGIFGLIGIGRLKK
jgi:hypothetical protein